MSKYILDKAIKLEEGIDNVDNISLDDELVYTHLSDGLRIEGNIKVRGNYIKSDNSYPLEESIDVDILFSGVNEGDLRSTRLYISDFSYQLIDDTLMMKIIYELQVDECKEQFSLEDQIKGVIKDLENDPNPFISKIRSSLSEEDAKMLEKALNGDFSSFEIISSQEEESVHPYVDLSEEEELIIPVEEYKLEEELDLRKEESTLPLVMEENPSEEVKEENNLFKEESYAVVASFYKCKKGDTYASIADANMVDINDLVAQNNNKDIEEGTLLLIKK